MIIDMQEAIKNKTAHPNDTPADVKIAIKDLNLYYGAFHALHASTSTLSAAKSPRSSGRPAAANRRC